MTCVPAGELLDRRAILKKSFVHGLVLFAIGLVVISADQYTKYLVRKYCPLNTSWNPIPWLDRFVTLTYVKNTGAAFGIFPDMSIVFAIIALVVVVLILVYYRRLSEVSWILRVAFGLQLGGAIGNLIDRVARGYVTDFIDVRVWPVFNIADSSVVVGTILLAYYALFLDRGPEQVASGEARTDLEKPDVA